MWSLWVAMDPHMVEPSAIHRELSSFRGATSTGYCSNRCWLSPSDQVAEHSAMALGWLKQPWKFSYIIRIYIYNIHIWYIYVSPCFTIVFPLIFLVESLEFDDPPGGQSPEGWRLGLRPVQPPGISGGEFMADAVGTCWDCDIFHVLPCFVGHILNTKSVSSPGSSNVSVPDSAIQNIAYSGSSWSSDTFRYCRSKCWNHFSRVYPNIPLIIITIVP